MSSPPKKKIKISLGLSDCGEPLSQQDVIAFQKEALFRALHKYKCREELADNQVTELKKSQSLANEQMGNICGIITSIARILKEVIKNTDNNINDLTLCDTLLNGTKDDIINKSDEFIKTLHGYLLKNDHSDGCTGQIIHELQSLNEKLCLEHNSLSKEVDLIKSYYENLLNQYDRDDSLTVKKIFKQYEDPKIVPLNKEIGSISTNNDKNKKTNVEDTKEGTITQIDHDLQISDLQGQINILESVVKDLNELRLKNENEMIELRHQLIMIKAEKDKLNDFSSDYQNAQERINKLISENQELSQMNDSFLSKFQQIYSEREIFTNKLSSEFKTAQEALKKHNSALEKDLVRIRTARDELMGRISILEAQNNKNEMLSNLQLSLNLQMEKWETLQDNKVYSSNDHDVVLKELQGLEKAFKEISQLANKKYGEYLNQESIISKLTIEKTKADQKYFASMRSKDSILIENKNLTKNLTKSSELIQQLKDLEKTLLSKIENLHKQLQISQNNENRLIESNKASSLRLMDLTAQLQKAKKSNELFQLDNKNTTSKLTRLEYKLDDQEIKSKELQTKLDYSEGKCYKLHKALLSNGGDNGELAEELENFRTVVYCSLCSKNWKNTAIKTCGHVFCEECCKERLAARMRKCPSCNKPFSSNDLLVVHL